MLFIESTLYTTCNGGARDEENRLIIPPFTKTTDEIYPLEEVENGAMYVPDADATFHTFTKIDAEGKTFEVDPGLSVTFGSGAIVYELVADGYDETYLFNLTAAETVRDYENGL
jgi:hypothetical protein